MTEMREKNSPVCMFLMCSDVFRSNSHMVTQEILEFCLLEETERCCWISAVKAVQNSLELTCGSRQGETGGC